MSKVVIDDSKLVNIADAIRNKNGSANKYTPTEMATAIGDIKVSSGAELAPEDLVISGDCSYKFQNGSWDWFIEKFGDKITTKDITKCQLMFQHSKLSSIPFDFNINTEKEIDLYGMFDYCQNLISVPYVKNVKKVSNFSYMFQHNENLIEIPEDYFNTWDFSYINNTTNGNISQLFNYCQKLKKIPSDLSMFYSNNSNASNQFYNMAFYSCICLGKVTNLPVTPETITISNNLFQASFLYCCRLKQLTFSLNNGTPKIARWQKQVIDLTSAVGYSAWPLEKYGMSLNTKITNDASYQLLKDNEDSWTMFNQYSRYNHDSAVETINTLPDTSAYLAESGGTTNIIKFKGANGSATDGGAINTLTEAEIAVAAAKGWTVTLV